MLFARIYYAIIVQFCCLLIIKDVSFDVYLLIIAIESLLTWIGLSKVNVPRNIL